MDSWLRALRYLAIDVKQMIVYAYTASVYIVKHSLRVCLKGAKSGVFLYLDSKLDCFEHTKWVVTAIARERMSNHRFSSMSGTPGNGTSTDIVIADMEKNMAVVVKV